MLPTVRCRGYLSPFPPKLNVTFLERIPIVRGEAAFSWRGSPSGGTGDSYGSG